MKVYRWLGESIDTLCFICILTGSLFLFSYYWSDDCQMKYVEHVTEQFFDEAERLQTIRRQDYEALLQVVAMCSGGMQVSIQIRRDKLCFYQDDLREYFTEQSAFPLQAGDFIVLTIRKGNKERAVLFTTIWW